MEHRMRLVDFAFNEIKNRNKDIEVRLNDEKRQLIRIGDTIIFENIDTGDTIRVEVINLYIFDSFKELFDAFEHERLGLSNNTTSDIMNDFYTEEEQLKYDALGIEIKLI